MRIFLVFILSVTLLHSKIGLAENKKDNEQNHDKAQDLSKKESNSNNNISNSGNKIIIPVDNPSTTNADNLIPANDNLASSGSTKKEDIQKNTDNYVNDTANKSKNVDQETNGDIKDSKIKNSNKPENTSFEDLQKSSVKNSATSKDQDSRKIVNIPVQSGNTSYGNTSNPVPEKKDLSSKSEGNYSNSNSEDRFKKVSRFETFRERVEEKRRLRNGLDKQNNMDSAKDLNSNNNNNSGNNKMDLSAKYEDSKGSKKSRFEDSNRNDLRRNRPDHDQLNTNASAPTPDILAKNSESDSKAKEVIDRSSNQNQEIPRNQTNTELTTINNIEGYYIYNFQCNKETYKKLYCGYAPAYVPFKIAKNNYIDIMIREYDDELFLHETKIKEIEKDLPPYGSSGATERQQIMIEDERNLHNANLKLLGRFTLDDLSEDARRQFRGDMINYYNAAQNIKNYIKENENKVKFSDTLDYVELKAVHDDIVKRITGFDVKKLPVQKRRLIAFEEFRHDEEEHRIWRLEGRSPTKRHLDAFKAEDARFDIAVANIKKKYGLN